MWFAAVKKNEAGVVCPVVYELLRTKGEGGEGQARGQQHMPLKTTTGNTGS